MKLSITIDGQAHTLEVTRGNGLSCRLDGVPFEAEIAEVEPGVYSLLIGGKSFKVRVAPAAGDFPAPFSNNTKDYCVGIGGVSHAVSVRDPRQWPRQGRAKPPLEGEQNIKAPMPGKVVRILASEGQQIERGQGLVVVEAMKMQNEIRAPKSGRIERILVGEGQTVRSQEALLVIV